MNVNNLLRDMFIFFKKLRGSGTTTLLAKIAKENDVWVIVNNYEEGIQFGDKAVTLDKLKDRAYGFDNKPILIDNHVLLFLLEESIHKFTEQEEAIKTRTEVLRTLKKAIRSFEVCENVNLDNPRGISDFSYGNFKRN